MKHLKTYEGLLDIFKKKEPTKRNSINQEEVRDLVESDLESKNILGYSFEDIFTGGIYDEPMVKYQECYFKSKDGLPVLKTTTHFLEKITYAIAVSLNNQVSNLLGKKPQIPDNSTKSICLSVNVHNSLDETKLDYRDKFILIHKIFETINSERMTEYGIGYCMVNKDSSFDSILFYPL